MIQALILAKLYSEGRGLSIRAMVYFGGEKRVLGKFRRRGSLLGLPAEGAGAFPVLLQAEGKVFSKKTERCKSV
jgi:hypothetical protein